MEQQKEDQLELTICSSVPATSGSVPPVHVSIEASHMFVDMLCVDTEFC